MIHNPTGRVNVRFDPRANLWQKLPKDLKQFPRWTLWKVIDGTKTPVSPQGKKVDPHKKWLSFDDAVGAALQSPDVGIGIVLFESCGLVAIDLDDTQRWEDEAEAIIDTFDPHAYIELSPSGKGYHILMDGSLPAHRTRHKTFHGGKVEVYTKLRFLTVTGMEASGSPSDGNTKAAKTALREFVAPLIENVRDPESDVAQIEGEPEKISDEGILFEMAAIASNPENEGAQAFMDIYKNDDAFDRCDDPSDFLTSAISSLLKVTANTAQVERVMKACAAAPFYVDKRTEKPKMTRWLKSELPKMIRRELESRRLRKEERLQQVTEAGYEQDFVWMGPQNKFFCTRDGQEYGVEAINSTFRHLHSGGRGDPLISTLLLESPILERVSGRVWRPLAWQDWMADKKTISAAESIVPIKGISYVNSWRGYDVLPIPGDVDPWLDLLYLVIPDETLHDHIIHRMAYDVQFPAAKCMWHVLLTGVHGAGKDLLFSPLFKIFGNATAVISDQVMKSQYEDEFIGKKILNVQELSGLSKGSYERLKAYATADPDDLRLMNLKGSGKVPTFPIWSFYMTSNHGNAIAVEQTERRWLIIESQDRALTQPEVRAFLKWRDEEDGVAKMFNYLLSIDLSRFSPMKSPVITEAMENMVEQTKSETDIVIETKLASSSMLQGEIIRAKDIIVKFDVEENKTVTFGEVDRFLIANGWKRIRHIKTAVARKDGRTLRQHLRTYAPSGSFLHTIKGTELYEEIEELTGPGADFED